MTTEQANRRALTLLAVGAVAGILLGAAPTFHRSAPDVRTLPDDAIALVNGSPIRREEYAQAVALLASDKRTAVTDEDRVHILNRLIEEELLVQRGIEIGFIDSDRTIRKAITKAMLAAIVAESASEQPAEDDLRAFYTENPSLFTRAAPRANDRVAAEGNAAKLPPFEDLREQVEIVYSQRARDGALREYLEWLRSEAKITLAPEVRQ